MAGRILNRRELREQAEQTPRQEATDADTAGAGAATVKKKGKARQPAAPKGKKPRPKKAAPRLRARWGVFDGGMKQVAVFDYDQRTAAEEKVVALLSRNKGPYFLQIVKEAMPESAPVPGVPDE
jgi:hypothetical protein